MTDHSLFIPINGKSHRRSNKSSSHAQRENYSEIIGELQDCYLAALDHQKNHEYEEAIKILQSDLLKNGRLVKIAQKGYTKISDKLKYLSMKQLAESYYNVRDWKGCVKFCIECLSLLFLLVAEDEKHEDEQGLWQRLEDAVIQWNEQSLLLLLVEPWLQPTTLGHKIERRPAARLLEMAFQIYYGMAYFEKCHTIATLLSYYYPLAYYRSERLPNKDDFISALMRHYQFSSSIRWPVDSVMFGLPCRETPWLLQSPISWASIGNAFKSLYAVFKSKEGVAYCQVIRFTLPLSLASSSSDARSNQERTVSTRKRKESQGMEEPPPLPPPLPLSSRSKSSKKWSNQGSQEIVPFPTELAPILAQCKDTFPLSLEASTELADWLHHAVQQFSSEAVIGRPQASPSQAIDASLKRDAVEERSVLEWLNGLCRQSIPYIYFLWLWARQLSSDLWQDAFVGDAAFRESIRAVFRSPLSNDTDGLLFQLLDSGVLSNSLHNEEFEKHHAYLRTLVWLTEQCYFESKSLFESYWRLLMLELEAIMDDEELWVRVLWLQFEREKETNDEHAIDTVHLLRDMSVSLELPHVTMDAQWISDALIGLDESKVLKKAQVAYDEARYSECLACIEQGLLKQSEYEWMLLYVKTLVRVERETSVLKAKVAPLLGSLLSFARTDVRLFEWIALVTDHLTLLCRVCPIELRSCIEKLCLLAFVLVESAGMEALELTSLLLVLRVSILATLSWKNDDGDDTRTMDSLEHANVYIHQEIIVPAWSIWKNRHVENNEFKTLVTSLTRSLLALYAHLDLPKAKTADWNAFCDDRNDADMVDLYTFLPRSDLEREQDERDAFLALVRTLFASLIMGSTIEKADRESFETGFKKFESQLEIGSHALQAKRMITQWLNNPVKLDCPLSDGLKQASRLLSCPTVHPCHPHVGLVYLTQGLLLLRSVGLSSSATAITKKGQQANATIHSAIHFLKQCLIYKDELFKEAPAREAFVWQYLAEAYDKWTDFELLKLTQANRDSIARHANKAYWCLVKAIQLVSCVGGASRHMDDQSSRSLLKIRLGDLVALKLGSRPLCCLTSSQGQRYALSCCYKVTRSKNEPKDEKRDWRFLFKRANCLRKLAHSDVELTRHCLDMYAKALSAYQEHQKESGRSISTPFDLYYRLFTSVYKGYRKGFVSDTVAYSLLSLSETKQGDQIHVQQDRNIYQDLFLPFLSYYIGQDKSGYEHRFVYRRCRLYYEDLGEQDKGLHELASRLFHHLVPGLEASHSTVSSSADVFNVWKSTTERPGLYYYYVEKYTRLLITWSFLAAQWSILERLKSGLCKTKVQLLNMEEIKEEIENALKTRPDLTMTSE